MPGKDLESAAELEDPKAHNPKHVSAWIYWRANVLYWIGTLIFVPLTGERHGRVMGSAKVLRGDAAVMAM